MSGRHAGDRLADRFEQRFAACESSRPSRSSCRRTPCGEPTGRAPARPCNAAAGKYSCSG
jgi:hypothetical protein